MYDDVFGFMRLDLTVASGVVYVVPPMCGKYMGSGRRHPTQAVSMQHPVGTPTIHGLAPMGRRTGAEEFEVSCRLCQWNFE